VAFLLFTLAYVFSMDAEHFSLIVLDQDKTPLSRQYVADLTSDGTFQVMAYVGSYAEIDAWLQAGRANAALVIPPGTADAVHVRRPAPVQAILDGVDAIAAGQAVGQLNARTTAFAMTLLPQVNERTPGALDVRGLAWYNPLQKSLVSMVPGLMALVLVTPTLALSLTREKELGSFERLAATPIRGLEYLLGKLLTYTGFGLVSALPMMLVAILWFRVPFRGNLFVFLALACCYLLASEGVSVLVANFVKSQQTAMLIVILVFFVPSFFLAGLILPIDKTSIVSSAVAAALPASHLIVIARGVFLKGSGIGDLASPTLALLVMGGGTVMLGLALFRKWIA
jgi:ABC-type multidrug transport system permease subunit